MHRLTAGLLALALTCSAAAHDDEKNPQVRYRHAVMEAMANDFAAMALLFRGDVDRPGDLAANARSLAESASLIEGLFPAGSEGGHALPLVWEEPERVATVSREAAAAARALAEAAGSDDRAALAKAFKAAGDSCKACHERYKEDDD